MLSQCWASSGDVGLLLNQLCVCYLHFFPIARTHSPPSGNAQCPSYIYTNKYPHVCTPVYTPPHLYVQIHIDGGASAKNFLSGRSQIINAKTCRKQFCGAYKSSFTRGMTWWPGRLTSPCDVIMVAFFVHLIWSRYLKAGKPKYISKMKRTMSCDFYVRLQISLAWRKCRFINHMSTLESGHHLLTLSTFFPDFDLYVSIALALSEYNLIPSTNWQSLITESQIIHWMLIQTWYLRYWQGCQ